MSVIFYGLTIEAYTDEMGPDGGPRVAGQVQVEVTLPSGAFQGEGDFFRCWEEIRAKTVRSIKGTYKYRLRLDADVNPVHYMGPDGTRTSFVTLEARDLPEYQVIDSYRAMWLDLRSRVTTDWDGRGSK